MTGAAADLDHGRATGQVDDAAQQPGLERQVVELVARSSAYAVATAA